MLAEAMPAATSAGALGIDSLLALWVVALADPEWIMPPRLARQAVAAALRAQGRDTNQWVGFMRQSRKGEAVSSLRHIELEDARSLEDADTPTDSVCHPEGVGKEDTRRLGRRPEGVSEEGERLGRRVRNTLRVLHAALGLNFTFGHWGKYTGDRENGAMYVTLQQPGYDAVWLQHERLIAPVVTEEARLLDAWASPTTALSAVTAGLDARLLALDDETRRAAFDAHLLPSSLLLLQAALSSPPMRASKHGLTMLSRQWRKLSSEINPRDEQRMLLERVQANTGTGSTAGAIASTATEKQTDQSAVVGKAANDCVGDKGKGKRRSEEGSQVDTLAELSKLSSPTPSPAAIATRCFLFRARAQVAQSAKAKTGFAHYDEPHIAPRPSGSSHPTGKRWIRAAASIPRGERSRCHMESRGCGRSPRRIFAFA
jgi:hypothetical protein